MSHRSALALWLIPPLIALGACDRLTARSVYQLDGKFADVGPNPECPHDYAPLAVATTDGPSTGPVRVSPPVGSAQSPAAAALGVGVVAIRFRTGVPEFHDCQRLLVRQGGSFEFGPLAAIFALDSIESSNDTAFSRPTVVGLVYKPEAEAYQPLRLESVFSCVVLYRQPPRRMVRGWMVARSKPEDCLGSVAPSELAVARHLKVKILPWPDHMDATDVPPVARWDFSRSGVHYVGIRCGGHWCEVGPRLGSSDTFDSSEDYDDPNWKSPRPRRNVRVKGWYDEQQLATYTSAGLGPPLPDVGTVIPTAGLDSLHEPTYEDGAWMQVAQVNMRPSAGPYAASFNFYGDPGPPPRARHASLALCRDGTGRCRPEPPFTSFDATECTGSDGGERWIARVSSETGPPKYFCVLFRKHPAGFHVPNVVRWRWRADDETIWVSCPAGCCEVNAKKR